KLFRPMAATVLFALAGAFVLSLTLVPVLVSLFVRGEHDREPRPLALARRGFERAFDWTGRHRWSVLIVAGLLLATSVVGFQFLGAEFIPTLDEGSILLEARRLPGTALSTSVETDLRLERALRTRLP